MPSAALDETEVDYVLNIGEIGRFLAEIGSPFSSAISRMRK
jgi:hypothetical protein